MCANVTAPKQNAAGDARARIADPRLWQLKKTLRKECGLITGGCPTNSTDRVFGLLSGVDTKCIWVGLSTASAVKNHTHLLVEVFASFFLHGCGEREPKHGEQIALSR